MEWIQRQTSPTRNISPSFLPTRRSWRLIKRTHGSSVRLRAMSRFGFRSVKRQVSYRPLLFKTPAGSDSLVPARAGAFEDEAIKTSKRCWIWAFHDFDPGDPALPEG